MNALLRILKTAGLVLLLTSGARSSPVHAQSTSPGGSTTSDGAQRVDVDQEARALFEAGRIAYQNGRFADALPSLTRAYELTSRPELLFNIARCHDQLGQLQPAAEAYRRFLETSPDAENRNFVEGRLAILDGQLRERTDSVSMDAGPTEDSGEQTTLEPAPAEPASATEAPRGGRDDTMFVAGLVVSGVAVALAAAALGTGLAAESRYASLDASCPDRTCGEGLRPQVEELRTLGLTTDVLLGVGGVALVAGVVMLVLHAVDVPTTTVTARGGSLVLRF